MKYLIVIDMQKDFVTGALGTKEAQTILPGVIERILAARAAGEKVVYTLDTHSEDYLSTAEGKKLPVPHCIRGTAGWLPEAGVAEALGLARCFEKPTFGCPELAEFLKGEARHWNRPVNQSMTIELIGVCTDICVISNALLIKARMPEVPVSVDPDCCAGVTPQSHETALAAMKMCQIGIGGCAGCRL